MISFTWKYSIFQVIQIFIIICYFLQFLFCIGFGYNDVTINILQYELLLIFLWSLFSAIHESGTFNLYVLFLYMLCVFQAEIISELQKDRYVFCEGRILIFHICAYSAYSAAVKFNVGSDNPRYFRPVRRNTHRYIRRRLTDSSVL